MIGVIGIVVSLGLLIYLAYRGINVLFLAPIMATLAVLTQSWEAPVLGTYTQIFMTSLGEYVIRFFPLFMLGALFGKLMDDSGSARVIATAIAEKTGSHRAILAIVLSCAILTYGGVSLFVVAFAVFPIAAAMFRVADVPKRLIPGAIALGSFTFTMTAFPGTPAIQNAIPMPFFGTTPFAAPGLGLIGGTLMFIAGILWLNRRAAMARSRGEGYGEHIEEAPRPAHGTPIQPTTGQPAPRPQSVSAGATPADATAQAPAIERPAGPPFWMAILPIILVIGLNYLFSTIILPAMDTGYLAEPEYGETELSSVLGIWSIVSSLVIACTVVVLLNYKRYANLAESINKGTLGSMLPIFNTASEVGYGAVIASLAGFAVIRDAVMRISADPVISVAISVNLLAGITGSASGGLSIVLSALGDTYLEMAAAAGINPEIMHRVASMASGGFDALPHNGAVITLLAICGLTHRQSYFDVFMVSCVFTVASMVVVIGLNTVFGTF
jgi:H+/gluconate symporter-like permease